MGQALYKKTGEKRYKEESEYFLNRARDYVNLFDSKAGFFQGRDAEGRLAGRVVEVRPAGVGLRLHGDQRLGLRLHRPAGLAAASPTCTAAAPGSRKKLDTYFATPETASPEFVGSYGGVIHEMTEARDVRMGMYGHSNQVAHHVTYMYDAAGQPWKTQEKVREVLSRLYTGSEIGQGYHGDEDNGEQSAWYLFSSLGFYPLVMGSGEYAIGSPLFTKATVHLENGRELVVKAPKNSAKNVYVQGLKVNGKTWTSTSLPHSIDRQGRRRWSSTWGRSRPRGAPARTRRPVSITQDDKVPSPREDVIKGEGALFDNSSATTGVRVGGAAGRRRRREGRAVHADVGRPGEGAGGLGPAGLVRRHDVEDLDKRSGQSFAWDKQTRAFSVSKPGTYENYRLVLAGGAAATLAEVELLS